MIIETHNLTKQYNGHGGCKDINLSIKEGTIFGFLGPNGAGKSTFVKTLVGLLHPTSGSASILGKPLGNVEVKKRIGFLPENFRYHDWMTGLECLKFHAELYKMNLTASRADELLELVKLKGHENKKVGNYSKGMQQRLGLAIALLPSPDIVFLDEPTSALDPIGRIEVREIIKRLKQEGKTVFLNSHLLSEVERICDHIAIINKGHIVAQGDLNQLLTSTITVKITVANPSDELIATLRSQYDGVTYNDGILSLTVGSKDKIPEIARTIVQSGALLYEMNTTSNSLEDLFINLVEKDDVK